MTTAIKTKRKPQVLNSRQRQFAVNYASGTMTMTEAYIRAGYSPIEAGSCAATLFNGNASLQAYFNELVRRKEQTALQNIAEQIMQPHEVKARLSELARANLVDFLDEDGNPKLSRDVPHHSAAKKYYRKSRVDKKGNSIESSEISLHDQVEALRELAKIYGLYAPAKSLHAHKVMYEVRLVDKGKIDNEEVE